MNGPVSLGVIHVFKLTPTFCIGGKLLEKCAGPAYDNTVIVLCVLIRVKTTTCILGR